jgi:hypothetical protein
VKGVKKMEEKKLTKKDYYNLIKGIIENTEVEGKDGLMEFIDKQVAQIEAKAEKAKERAAEKKVVGDELREIVKGALTNEYQTANDITEKIDDEEVTKAKVVARLTQLVKAGEVEKADAKTEDNKNVKVYKLAE